jgi:hypothetical protein
MSLHLGNDGGQDASVGRESPVFLNKFPSPASVLKQRTLAADHSFESCVHQSYPTLSTERTEPTEPTCFLAIFLGVLAPPGPVCSLRSAVLTNHTVRPTTVSTPARLISTSDDLPTDMPSVSCY